MGSLPIRIRTWVLAGLFVLPPVLEAADAGSRATYVGGTVAALPRNAGGTLETTDQDSLLFRSRNILLRVAYRQVNLIEYGQKVDRRYLAAVVISPLFLLSKSRKHFVTLGYADEDGRQQAVVFQVAKGEVRPLLAGLEARTGLKVTYQDAEARRSGKG
jgi:hypothetical protein